jgi:hypothetical protein
MNQDDLTVDEKTERIWATICHLGALFGYVCPLGNIIFPLAVWLVKRQEISLVDAEGKKSLNFQISITIYAIAAIVLMIFFTAGTPLLIGVGLFNIFMVILAAVKVSNGESFSYPITIRFIR